MVAASLLGVAALAQLVAVLVYFGPGFAQTAGPSVVPAAAPETALPPAAVISAVVEEPVPTVPEDAGDEARLTELMKEVEKLEGGPAPGDALVPLEEAVSLQPRNPEILARMASLQERLGQAELAQDTWRNILDLGPDAGRFLDVAEIRLRLLRQDHHSSMAGSLELRDQVGLQPGSTLGVVDLKLTDSSDAGEPIKDLRLAVKARPGETVDEP